MNDRWMTAADVAELLQVGVDAVYTSAALRRVARTLGETGPGKRPRLRWMNADLEQAFPPAGACDARKDPDVADARPDAPRRRAHRQSPGTSAESVPLLEIKGRGR